MKLWAYSELFALSGQVTELGRLLGLANRFVDVVGDLFGRLEGINQVLVVWMTIRRITE